MPSWFVLFSLFLPRTTLLFCWVFGAIPANDTPFFLDLLGALIAPRLLVAAWLWDDPAWGLGWALVFVLASLVAGGGQARGGQKRWERTRKDV